MKAVLVREFGGPEVLRCLEAPDPVPAQGEVRVRIHAAGVNPVETYIRSGVYASLPSLPYTPGSDGAGVVESVGEGVTRWRPGDRVYLTSTRTGSYAELAVCPEGGLEPLPERLSFGQGAAIHIPYATAYRALLQRAKALPGETVLVHGASGGVGVAAVQIARAHGLNVFGTAGSDEGLRLVREAGAHQVFDHRSSRYLEAVAAATEGRGVDVILEMLANVNLGHDLKALARGGRVVVIGSRGNVEITPRDTMAREAAILGMVLFNTPPDEMRRIHAALGAGLENGTLTPQVGRELPLEEAPRAHELVMSPGARGKIVLLP